MYRLSQLPRKVLITTDEVIKQGHTDNNPEIKQLLAAIQIAEERFIKPAICKGLYYDFRNKKNVVIDSINKTFVEGLMGSNVTLKVGDIVNAIEFVDNGWYVELWNEHLWKLLAECVIYIASPTNFSRFSASGEMENSPKSITTDGQSSASVDLSKMKFKLDKMMMDRIDPLIAGMKEWLFDNRGHFAFYNCHQYNDRLTNNNSGISVERKSAWVHIYDNHVNSCCK